MNWKTVLVEAANIAYGLLNLAIFVSLATLDGSIFREPSEKAKKELAAGMPLISQLRVVSRSND